MWTAAGICRRNCGIKALDVVDYLDGVGAGLALDGQHHGAVDALGGPEPAGGLVVFDAVDHFPQLGQTHRVAVAIGDDQRPVILGPPQLSIGIVDRERLVRAVEGAGGLVDVALLDGGYNFVDADLRGWPAAAG